MIGFKFLEFKKSQYSYEAIEKALSEKVSEGWKVVSMHTEVSSDIKGVVVVLLQQIIPGEEETMSFQELYQKKQQELELKKIQKEIDDVDMLPAGYTLDPDRLGAAVALSQTDAMKNTGINANGAINGFLGLGAMGAVGGNNATAALNSVQTNQNQPKTGKFCTNCGALARTGKFCANCGNPI